MLYCELVIVCFIVDLSCIFHCGLVYVLLHYCTFFVVIYIVVNLAILNRF
jgi:hypothetical protein